MSAARPTINILAPNVCNFPELKAFGKGVKRPKQPTENDTGNKASPSVIVTGNKASPSPIATAMAEEGGNGRSLYVIDSKGNLLEHVRYQGNDHRYALRTAISMMSTNSASATGQRRNP